MVERKDTVWKEHMCVRPGICFQLRALGQHGDGVCKEGLGHATHVCQWALGEMCTETEQVSLQPLARFVCFHRAFELQAGLPRFQSKKKSLAPVSDLIGPSLADSSGFLFLLEIFTGSLGSRWGINTPRSHLSFQACRGHLAGLALICAPWNLTQWCAVQPWDPSGVKAGFLLDTPGPPAPRPPWYQLPPV